MAVVCRTYTAEQDARDAVEALLAAGIPGERIQVLTGEPDARVEHHGSFADKPGEEPVGDEEIGDFAGRERLHGSPRGTFAGEEGLVRGGSFSDTDRETLTTYGGGVQQQFVSGDDDVRRLLLGAGLSEEDVDRNVEALRAGRILVLADVGDRDPAAAFGA